MKFSNAVTYTLAASTSVHALSVPDNSNTNAIAERDAKRNVEQSESYLKPAPASLERRKGGGGGGGRGGGGSSGGGGGGRGGSGGSPGAGPPRSYGGGGFYGGGAAAPYSASQRSPSGIVPAFVGGAVLGTLFVGTFAAGAYLYPYGSNYRFRNESGNRDEDLPVKCFCEENQQCGCDENSDSDYLKDLIGDGDYNKLNKTLVQVTEPNGTRTLVLNGTLPPGTEAPTSAAGRSIILEQAGLWTLAGAMAYALMA